MACSKPGGRLAVERCGGVDSSLSKSSNHGLSSNAFVASLFLVCWASLLPNPLLLVCEETDEVSSADGIEGMCRPHTDGCCGCGCGFCCLCCKFTIVSCILSNRSLLRFTFSFSLSNIKFSLFKWLFSSSKTFFSRFKISISSLNSAMV